MYYPTICQQDVTSREITVTGNGSVTATANAVQIQLEVITEGKEVVEAQQKNATIMNNVIKSLIALNIPRENIQTTTYTITPIYDFIDGKQVFRGYEVTNAITVTINDITQVGLVIDTAVQHGVTRVSSIQFKLDNTTRYYQQALSIALHDAEAKARTIAATMQLSLHPQPIEIIEESRNEPIPYRQSFAMATEAATTPIEQGQITIRATVRVKFQY